MYRKTLIIASVLAACGCVPDEGTRSEIHEREHALELPERGECGALIGDVLLDDQLDVVQFGTLTCETIVGDLRIENASDLTPLTDLAVIQGDLILEGLTSMNVEGLDNLQTISGELRLGSTEVFTANFESLTAVRSVRVNFNRSLGELSFPSLTSVASTIRIESNPSLTTISAPQVSILSGLKIAENNELSTLNFEGLTEVDGELDLRTLSSLGSLSGLAALETVNGRISIISTGLPNLDGLRSLVTVGEDVLISNNDTLNDLSGLAGVEQIPGHLILRSNDQLSDLADLSGLQSVASRFVINSNASLTNLDGLDSLTEVDHLQIEYNDSLTALGSLPSLTNLNRLVLEENDALTDLSGPALPANVDFFASGNSSLVDFSSLQAAQFDLFEVRRASGLAADLDIGLSSVRNFYFVDNNTVTNLTLTNLANPDFIRIDRNDGLASVSGPALTSADVAFERNLALTTVRFPALMTAVDLRFTDHPSLTTLEFGSLTQCSDDLRLIETNVADLSGFPALTTVADEVEFRANPGLESFTGMNSLNSVGGDMFIVGNTALTSVTELDTLNSIGMTLTVTDNPMLLDCEVSDFAASVGSIGSTVFMNNGGIVGCP